MFSARSPIEEDLWECVSSDDRAVREIARHKWSTSRRPGSAKCLGRPPSPEYGGQYAGKAAGYFVAYTMSRQYDDTGSSPALTSARHASQRSSRFMSTAICGLYAGLVYSFFCSHVRVGL